MGTQIEDGSGTGRSAKVDSENRLHVGAITTSAERHVNQVEGEAYNVLFAVNPAGADDVIFYIKNTGIVDMVIEGIWWQTSAAEEVYYNIGDTGTAVATAGAAVTPANLNAASGRVADVTCLSNVADGAVDITGLTAGTTIQKLWLTSATSSHFNAEQDIIIPQNQTFTIYCVGGDTLLRGTVVINFHDVD